jgi:hypothetical protein
MTGPEHYAEGERLLASCADYSDSNGRQAAATQALAHFAAAEIALLAAAHQPDSIAWREVTRR